MIERGVPNADGVAVLRCFKCWKWHEPKDFMYAGKATSEDDLQRWVQNGHAWACEGCFTRSAFCTIVLDAEDEHLKRRPHPEFPDVPWEDTTKCIRCKCWLPANFYTCYGNWWKDVDGNDESETGTGDALQAFVRRRCLLWGCNCCFADSKLYAYRSAQSGQWASRSTPRSSVATEQDEAEASSSHCQQRGMGNATRRKRRRGLKLSNSRKKHRVDAWQQQ